MAETARNAGFSRHALRGSAAHGATSTCGMVLFCAYLNRPDVPVMASRKAEPRHVARGPAARCAG